MELSETRDWSHQLLADEGVSQSIRQTHRNQQTQSHHSQLHQPGEDSLQLEFQDSTMSPALHLLPARPDVEHNFTYSFSHQSVNEFATLSAYPDVSAASEMTTQVSECRSLSQHSLTQPAALSEERSSSCCSLSQHSLSPEGESQLKGICQSPADKPRASSTVDKGDEGKDLKSARKLIGKATEDEAFFLSKDIPAQQLLKCLQKDIGMLSSSSAISSGSGNSVRSSASLIRQSESTNVCNPGTEQTRDGSLSQQQPDVPNNPERSQTLSSELCNITTGSRSTQPDDSTEALHTELLAETERRSKREAESENQPQKSPTTQCLALTPNPTVFSETKSGVTGKTPGSVPWTCAFTAGLLQVHQEQDHTGIDGSYLGFLPQSQSTPGFFKTTPKSIVQTKLGQLSVVESDIETSYESNPGPSPQPADPVVEDDWADTPRRSQEKAPAAKVQSLPCLNYMQKVDAWRANQSSGKTSLFHSLALQGFAGVSPKKKAYDAAPDSLNHTLRQVVEIVQQPPTSSAANQTVTESSSIVTSPTNEEALGKDKAVSVAHTGASPFGRSQSHSSLSTVVTLGQTDTKTIRPVEKEKSQIDDAQPPSTSAQVLPLNALGPFSDVALSSSQDSYISGVILGASVGASSITSLEVDNYTPFWTSKLSTPPPQPRQRELNIEERIPVYLHNLGIHQSPSTILNPFVPRGPIREPEFSPTELGTIRGSIGTPTQSAQPSEGSSPHKVEFSRSSILSVDSSISIPLCLDSLGPAASFPDQAHASSDTEAMQMARGMPCSLQPDEDSRVSTPRYENQQPKDRRFISNQDVVQLRQRADSDVSSGPQSRRGEGNMESPVQTNRSISAEVSFVNSKAMRQKHRLSQLENVASTGSCAEYSTAAAGFGSVTKTLGVQDSSFSSSSAAEDIRTHSSLLVVRAPSDSMLTSEKQRPILVLPKPARRTEPEGCSAVPIDGRTPSQLVASKPLPPESTQHLSPASPDTLGAPEEQDKGIGNPAHSGSSSLAVDYVDQGALIDASSEGSLAVRVSEALHSESPSTVVSSSNSVTNHEDGEARGWQQCEPVIDREVREQIEMQKLQLNSLTSQESTDTESVDSLLVRVQMKQDPPHPAEGFNTRLMPGLSPELQQFSAQLLHHSSQDLEALIQRIAAREGFALPRTSTTVGTWKRAASSSLPTTPASPLSPPLEPLHLSELSTGSVEHPEATKQFSFSQDKDGGAARETALVSELSSVSTKTETPNSQSGIGQDSSGGQLKDYCRHSETVRDGKQSPGLTASESSTRTAHATRVCFTLSPKAFDLRQTPVVHGRADVQELPPKTLVTPTHCSAANSPGVGFSTPPQGLYTRGQIRPEGLERRDSSTLFKPTVPQGTSIQTFTPAHRADVFPGHLNTPTAAVPVLLPYKPRGSEELFYVPHTEADVSSASPSETTVESSHTGSDDAVPPNFGSDVLGLPNPGLDRGVSIRHTEGIYSKRFIMQQPRHREASVAADKSGAGNIQVPKPLPQASLASTRLLSSSGAQTRNQGTSPDHVLSFNPPETSSKMNDIASSLHLNPSITPGAKQALQPSSEAAVQHPQRSLDELWQKFCHLWSLEESQPTPEREASVLERLERLSRLIHSTRAATQPERGEEAKNQKPGMRRMTGDEKRKEQEGETETDVWGSGQRDDDPPSHTWTKRLQRDSHASCASSLSHSSFQSQHLCPADRDETGASSPRSGSMSTIDTSRLIRAFGAHRVQRPKSSHSLSKLYNTINKQKEGGEQRRGRNKSPPISPQSETTGTDESVAADSASSTSTYTLPSHRGPSRALAARKAVKLVSKGIQAGDLEIVSNGTRHHTRDVGTTFPSPGGEARAVRPLPSSSTTAERRAGDQRSLLKNQGSKKQSASRRSPAKPYPEGVSWFISAEELRSEARKENQPTEDSSAWRPSTAWFEPYGTRPPWREPLRERQIQHKRTQQPTYFSPAEPDPELRAKTLSSGRPRVSLQEALEMRRPEFISQSRQRMRRLALQVEERKLKPVFSREEEELFRESGLRRRPDPGRAFHRRAVPRKEMIQRSRQIYENLPEVQRRREEEKRKAEYRSYRLNAKLYNKRITNRVLGRRSGWQQVKL